MAAAWTGRAAPARPTESGAMRAAASRLRNERAFRGFRNQAISEEGASGPRLRGAEAGQMYTRAWPRTLLPTALPFFETISDAQETRPSPLRALRLRDGSRLLPGARRRRGDP